tara:strand:+ start:590 stop:811 length:222 start_codon:yes stop_codon:yes gene_type:complete
MSDLRATNYKGRTAGSVPNLPDGVKIGTGVTVNNTGLNVVGVVTATSFSGDGSVLTNLNIPTGFNELDAALFN